MQKPVHISLICAAFLLASLDVSVGESTGERRLRETITALSTNGSRLAGYPGDRFAANFVERELTAAGVENVKREPYEVVVPMDHGASMHILRDGLGSDPAGLPIEVQSLWPNLVRTNTIGPQGLEGELIYAGMGEYADFNGERLEGSIALMEFNSGKNWKNAAALGAAAVIFIEPEETTREESRYKWSWTPVDVPRFWIKRDAAAALRQRMEEAQALWVRLHARMDWESHTTWNIWGRVSGTDSTLADELVAVHAYYDGNSVVPADNPAAESAASIAALLEFARYLKIHPPARPVVLLATSSHFLGHRGVYEFFDRHARTDPLFKKRMPTRLVVDEVDTRRLIEVVEREGLDLDSLGVVLGHAGNDEPPPLESVDIERLAAQVKLRRLDADSLGLPLEPDSLDIALFVAIDLSTHGNQVGLVQSAEPEYRLFFVPLGRSFTRYARTAASELGRRADGLVNLISPIKGQSADSYLHFASYVEDGLAARHLGIMALNLVTTADARLVLDTPLDTPDKVDFANLQQQSEMINSVLHQALTDPDLFGADAAANRIRHDKNIIDAMGAIDGRMRLLPKRGATPDDPVPNAVVTLVDQFYDFMWRPRIYLADEEGNYAAGVERIECQVTGFALDETTGDITHSTDMGERAQDIGLFTQTLSKPETVWTTILFPSVSIEIHERIHAHFHWTFGNWREGMKILDQRGAPPRQFGSEFGDFDEQMMVLFGAPGDSLRLIDDSLLLLNNEAANDELGGQGRGFDLGGTRMVPHASMQSMLDMWRLDDLRIERMREFAIENPRVDALHERAWASYERAVTAMQALDWGNYAKYIREALGFEYRAYPDVRGTQSDVLNGLVFFIALLIPAAFFSERLIFASTDIRRQLTFFGLIMLVAWIVLSQVHPAFGLAHPIIVLLALMVLVTAFLVISLIAGRFNGFMDELREHRMGTAAGDISRTGTTYAAFMLGISNMRRRAMRTCLTLGTITALTFTVLSFTSAQPEIRFVGFEKNWKPSYAGVLMHDVHWWGWEPTHLDFLESHFGEHGTVVARNWLTMGWHGDGFVPIRRGAVEAQALGVSGMSPDEPLVTGLDRALTAGTWLGPADDDGIILSDYLAAQLGLTTQEVQAAVGKAGSAPKVSLFGRSWRVVGLFDGDIYDRIRDLNNSPITPAKQRFEQLSFPGMDRLLESSNLFWGSNIDIGYEHLAADRLAIVPFKRLDSMGYALRSVAIALDKPEGARELVESYLTRARFRLFVGMPDSEGTQRVYSYTSLSVTGMEGLSNLVVPLLIAALIVLNTMMGSVYERFREIGVYSSVGLAPVHIAFLFIAEACVYGVLGITLGYLVGQVGVKLLLAFDLLGGVSLNYSSTSAIAASILVMAVVVISALYPARVASRVAVPDVVRRWQLPDPEGDTWQFAFPFTANARAIESLCGYLCTYFRSYGHESVGKMYTEKTRIVAGTEQGQPVYSVQLLLWLAPFDMGVSQYLQFTMAPSSIPGIYGIDLYIERISGPVAFWQRLNLRFMLELRKQFLVWQTLGDELQAQHMETCREQLGKSLGVRSANSPEANPHG